MLATVIGSHASPAVMADDPAVLPYNTRGRVNMAIVFYFGERLELAIRSRQFFNNPILKIRVRAAIGTLAVSDADVFGLILY